MARIIIDGTVIKEKGFGASRYTLNLIRGLANIDNINQYIIFLDKQETLPDLPSKDNFIYRKVKARPSLYWRLFKLPLLAKNVGCDILHSPVELLPLIGPENATFTVHEIPKIRHSLRRASSIYEEISRKISERLFPFSLHKAKKVIAVSQSTKRDLIEMFKIEEGKIEVIWEAAEEKFRNELSPEEKEKFRRRIGAEEGYILNFVTGDTRENTEIVLDAWEEVVTNNPIEKKLVLAGFTTKKKRESKRKVNKRNLRGKVSFLGFVDEETLVKLYSVADIYVDISYYEGFGLQVVEAMACGTPVITSNVTSLPEVVDDGGILVGLNDKDALAHEILNLLTDERKRKKLSKKAVKSASRFSWKKTAEKTLKVWNNILKE